MSGVAFALAAVLILAGCASPEVKRTRGNGPGADVGNRGKVVELHEGADPYYKTPRIISPQYAAGAKRDERASAR